MEIDICEVTSQNKPSQVIMDNEQEVTTCCEWQQKYNELVQKTSAMEKEICQLKKRLSNEKKEVRGHCQHFYRQETANKSIVNELKEKVEILGNVVIRMEERVKEQENKLIEMQARSMRKNLVISGIEEPKNETSEQLLEAINTFISEKLKVQEHIPIKVYHRLNYVDGSAFRPVIIKLRSIDHKVLLLSNAVNLKGQQNSRHKYFYLNEQLPEKMAEDRRYAQLWIKENKSKPDDQKLPMKIHKNKLRVNDKPYIKKVQPPTAAEIIRLDTEEVVTINKAATVYGDSQLVECSEFISYAMKINSVEDVRIAYRKLRMRYADASHISSAYRLDPTNGPYNQEGLDDGEFGAGRAMIQLMQEKQVLNAAVFMVRFYGGKKIGAQRFDVIKHLATIALQKAQLLTTPVNARRQTRSMSQRGRAVKPSGFVAATTQKVKQITDSALHAISHFRLTPASSPAVSPSHQSDNHSTGQPSGNASDNDILQGQTSYDEEGDDEFSEAHSGLEDDYHHSSDVDQTGIKMAASDFS